MISFNKIAMDIWDIKKKCKCTLYLPRSLRFTGNKVVINQIYKLEICKSTSLPLKKMNQFNEQIDCCNHNNNFPYFKKQQQITLVSFPLSLKRPVLMSISLTCFLDPSSILFHHNFHHVSNTMLTKCPQTHDFINKEKVITIWSENS